MHKTERVGLLVTPVEKKAIANLAELRGGLSQAALIRCLIREEAHRKGTWTQYEARVSTTTAVRHE